jgi:hypothetical protein
VHSIDPTRQLELAVPLVRDFEDISAHTVEVHRLESAIDPTERAADILGGLGLLLSTGIVVYGLILVTQKG